ncbi:unnamed protein product [Bemisia tabaci]|uniref:Uncharacterized protein n=1 Tax=Bemisia tabaci TaxID=7038 RepID=A0A9P0A9X7_BEMTA|nr:PREDICTED: uncharacterized protein LOC109031340 [Bemisia tabaci]XP_018898342.1 PREDICTED: uncharacterized protein LOC109031340 [Bemisia tabaci]CAH0387957.1 unnamed protein product [Bemisia tabaci]
MCIPEFTSCLCCISLRTGSLIIGWFYAIFNIIELIGFSIDSGSLFKEIFQNWRRTGLTIVRLMIVEYYFVLLIFTICAIYLIVGIKKDSPRKVRYFVVASMVSILNSIILGLIINLSPLKKYSDKLIDASIDQAYNSHVTVFGVTLVELLIDVYCLLVVHSYYRQMRREGATV